MYKCITVYSIYGYTYSGFSFFRLECIVNYFMIMGNINKFGLPEDYQTWSEKILNYLSDKKWRTSKQIRENIGAKLVNRKHPDFFKFKNVDCEIRRLVRDGYIKKAYAPSFLRTKHRHIKFVYKWTGKEKKYNYSAVGGGEIVKI